MVIFNDKMSNQLQTFLQEVEQRRLVVHPHELESNFFEGGSSLGKIHRTLDVVALLETVLRLLRIDLEKT